MDYTVLLFSGIISGILASLFGFGGGLTVVPALIICLPMFHIQSGLTMHIAIGTSFAIMLSANLNAVRHHHKSKNLDLSILIRFAPFIVIGTIIGSLSVSKLKSFELLSIYVVFVVFVITKYIIKLRKNHYQIKNNEVHEFSIPHFKITAPYGFLTGMISACIGGGSSLMIVPFLKHRHLSMKNSVAVTTALNVIIATTGLLSSIFTGIEAGHLPEYSLGFIYIPAFIFLLIGSFIGVPIGTLLVNKLKESILMYGYLTVLIIIFCIVFTKLLLLY
ncbi:MAG TPA: sulfite exporter TauE/SafE family protein [Victivallales bacterium]|nr:sulfite exporter TauE/SafE family protein [Victivallales bacterium]